MRTIRILFLAAIACGVLIFGYKLIPQVATKVGTLCNNCNVILISINGLGAEQTSLSTSNGDTTPFLKKFSSESITFKRAYASAPWTLPAVAAMLTGVYPWNLNVWDPRNALPPNTTTIAGVLKNLGYTTGGFSNGPYVSKWWNFDQGFDAFQNPNDPSSFADVPGIFDEGFAWAQKQYAAKTPFFLFVHPYELRSLEAAGKPAEDAYQELITANQKPIGPSAEDIKKSKQTYQTELLKTDTALKNFLAELDTAGILRNSLIIITGDNGIEFGEHGTTGLDFFTLHNELLHVPLLISYPHHTASIVDRSVETRSIPATILEILGQSGNPSFEAPSLVPYISGSETKDRITKARTNIDRGPFLSLLNRSLTDTFGQRGAGQAYTGTYQESSIFGPWHVIRATDGSLSLYNMDNDPKETENLISSPKVSPQDMQFLYQKVIVPMTILK